MNDGLPEAENGATLEEKETKNEPVCAVPDISEAMSAHRKATAPHSRKYEQSISRLIKPPTVIEWRVKLNVRVMADMTVSCSM